MIVVIHVVRWKCSSKKGFGGNTARNIQMLGCGVLFYIHLLSSTMYLHLGKVFVLIVEPITFFFLSTCVFKNVFIFHHAFGNVHGRYWTWFQAGVQWIQSQVSTWPNHNAAFQTSCEVSPPNTFKVHQFTVLPLITSFITSVCHGCCVLAAQKMGDVQRHREFCLP